MVSQRSVMAAITVFAGVFVVPASYAHPRLAPGLWRFETHLQGSGQNKTQVLVHCYRAPRSLKPKPFKACGTPVVHDHGSSATWVLSCTLDGGMVHIRSHGNIVYLDHGRAFREESVDEVTMPMSEGTRVLTTTVEGKLIGTCPAKG